jgi:N-acetyl-anhydromuramyl-L-alanine amidase AmpD
MKPRPLASTLFAATVGLGVLGLPRIAAAQLCPKGAPIVDQTALSDHSLRGKKLRDVGSLTAAVLHQMGFHRGNDATKYKNVKAHFVILPNGTIVQNHGIEFYLPASDGISQLGVAIEFAGNFQSVRKKWYHGSTKAEHHPTAQQYESGRCLLFHLRAKMPKLTHVLAHRQSGSQRHNDPGPEVWCNVGEWALKYMHLKDGGPGFKVTGGREIDPKWRSWCSI